MEITYTVKPEDIVAFHRYQMHHSPMWRRSITSGILAGFVTSAVLFIVMGGWQSWVNAVFPVLFLIVYLTLYPFYIQRTVNRTGSEMVKDGRNKGLWGPHTLTIDESELVERTEVGENRVKWQGLEKIAASPTHLFFFVSSNSAHIIPRSAFADPEQSERFLHQAELYFGNASEKGSR